MPRGAPRLTPPAQRRGDFPSFQFTIIALGDAYRPSLPSQRQRFSFLRFALGLPINATPRPINVLVVDDNVDAADSLATVLRLAGHVVNVAWNGEDALSAAKQNPPHVVVLDLGMPYMNGYETARRFREDPALKSASLVALTGWGTDEDRKRTTAAGFAHHLVKPADPTTVLAIVDGCINR